LMLAAFAARRGKPWMLAPAALLASPVIHGWLPIVLLAAIPRLRALTESTAATTSREGAAP
jgi:hypothetical protein